MTPVTFTPAATMSAALIVVTWAAPPPGIVTIGEPAGIPPANELPPAGTTGRDGSSAIFDGLSGSTRTGTVMPGCSEPHCARPRATRIVASYGARPVTPTTQRSSKTALTSPIVTPVSRMPMIWALPMSSPPVAGT